MGKNKKMRMNRLLVAMAISAGAVASAQTEDSDPSRIPLGKAELQKLVAPTTDKPLRPRFTALKVRLNVSDASKEDCKHKPAFQQDGAPTKAEEAHAQPLKCKQIERDNALTTAFRASGDEMDYLRAYQKVLVVCNDGMDFIASQIVDNVRRDTKFLYLAAAAGLVSGGTGSLVAAKTAGVLAAGTAAYKQAETLTPGTQYNNQTQQTMIEDIRQELSDAMSEFNRWLLMEETDEAAKAKRKKGLTYSLIAMNNACMFY